MSRIYLSYRRMDAAGYAGRLFDHLSRHFGPDSVFMDIGSIASGQDFAQVIESADAARRVCRLRFRPTLDRRVEPGDPRTIDLDRVAVPGCQPRLGHGVLCKHQREGVVQVLLNDLYRAEGVHEAHGNPARERGVRAGP